MPDKIITIIRPLRFIKARARDAFTIQHAQHLANSGNGLSLQRMAREMMQREGIGGA